MNCLALVHINTPWYLLILCGIAAAAPPLFLHYRRNCWRIPLWQLLGLVGVFVLEYKLVAYYVDIELTVAKVWGPEDWTVADQLLAMARNDSVFIITILTLSIVAVVSFRTDKPTGESC